ncbi:PepSY-like domain-containing protein [Chryseobacterium sp. RU37D]|uniref:PepSY-like domain-containing protein n=1 Tax=Chryseobacterium sp. RU37D TaxID=1907397 RepID=UPI0015C34CFD|nr:PepSY-like domain-containing protein [Chryseobacterium sp. RU37D]
MANWNLIKGHNKKFSAKSIRKSILEYLTTHHQGSLVSSIEKKYNAYKINLMNGLSLIFDAHGRHVKTSS